MASFAKSNSRCRRGQWSPIDPVARSLRAPRVLIGDDDYLNHYGSSPGSAGEAAKV